MQHYSLDSLLNRRVVMDTQGPLIYIGTLAQVDASGYWLIDADVHDRHDGHSTKEIYINEAHELERHGSRNVNRRRVFVERAAVVSFSALDDVVAESQTLEREERG
ncbi:hypothetical protein RAS1_39930 [Phycisphaerae bacterium RAS1]|nr:hypothetical protein RAS1_39930 [Phycisphaerae bacterium RAS1]